MEEHGNSSGDKEGSSCEVSSTEVKKMKQARLPFSPIELKQQKKKRSSSGDKNPKAAKMMCKGTKKLCLVEINNDIEIIEEIKRVNVDSPVSTKEEKENLTTVIQHLSLETASVNSPISKKYEADSSGIEKPSAKCDTSQIHEQKKRCKIISNNSPSIASLFKKMSDKKKVASNSARDLSEVVLPKMKKNDSIKESPKSVHTLSHKEHHGKTITLNTKKSLEECQRKKVKVDTRKSFEEPQRKKIKLDSEKSLERPQSKKIKIDSENSLEEPQSKKIKLDTETSLEEPKKRTKCNTNKSYENSSDSDLNDAERSIISERLSKDSVENSCVQQDDPSSVSTPDQKNVNEKMTPKQIQKVKERKLKQEEKEQLKAEKLKEKLNLKLKKETEKQSKKEEIQKVKDDKIKKKQEENEAKTKDRDDKRFKKEEEKQKRDQEKVKKDLEKQKRDEDKVKQEELKRLAEEEEVEKKEKLKQKFAKFFVPKIGEVSPVLTQINDYVASSGPFMMFRVKGNMKLAPLIRRELSDAVKQSFDALFKDSESTITYLQELKNPTYVKRKNCRTMPVQEKVDDCEILDEDCIYDANNMVSGSDSLKHTVKAKLLSFCENRRPAYYGTWSKKSAKVKGRTPFAREIDLFDYEYDSDDDWAEEEAGESLSDSEGEEEDDQGENKYEEDNVFFVPHGYLSDDEGQDEEFEDNSIDEKEKDGEIQKEMLKKKQEEFEIEMKQKMKPLKPKVYGCVWLHDEDSHKAYNQLLKIFKRYNVMNILGGEYPIGTTMGGANIPQDRNDLKANDEGDEANSTKKFVKNFPEAAVPDLIRLLHGNRHGKPFLVREFSEHVKKQNSSQETLYVNTPITPGRNILAKRKIEQKILSLGQYVKASDIGANWKQKCWTVPKNIREEYGLGDLSYENSWSYYHQPKEFPLEVKDEEIEEPVKAKTNSGLITKFTKVLTEQEKAEKMKNATPLIDGKIETVAEIHTPSVPSSLQSVSKNVKTPVPVKGKSAVKNIEKFFAKVTQVKVDTDCIQLD